jgi:hypothetical protein
MKPKVLIVVANEIKQNWMQIFHLMLFIIEAFCSKLQHTAQVCKFLTLSAQ